MKKLIFICLILSGCATTDEDGKRIAHDQAIFRAAEPNDNGDEKDPAKRLQKIIAKGKNEGITDQALFRLSLIHLHSGLDKENIDQARKRLEELQRDYPKSPWTQMAAPLIELLQRLNRDLRIFNQALIKESKEIQSLRGVNSTLVKENKELRQTIEKLKHLDLELDNKPRRY